MTNYIDKKQRRKLAYWAGVDEKRDQFCPEENEDDFSILLDTMSDHIHDTEFQKMVMLSVSIACMKYMSRTGFRVPSEVLYPNGKPANLANPQTPAEAPVAVRGKHYHHTPTRT